MNYQSKNNKQDWVEFGDPHFPFVPIKRYHEPLWWQLARRRMLKAPIYKLGKPNATAIRIVERRWAKKISLIG